MSERMTGKAFWPSKLFFMSLYVPGKKKGINRTGRIGLLREKPAGRTSAGEPVFSHNHLDFCTYEFEEYIGLLPLISSNP